MIKRIEYLVSKRNEVAERLEVAFDWLSISLDKTEQVEALQDGFNSILSSYDVEISHLRKMMKMEVSL